MGPVNPDPGEIGGDQERGVYALSAQFECSEIATAWYDSHRNDLQHADEDEDIDLYAAAAASGAKRRHPVQAHQLHRFFDILHE